MNDVDTIRSREEPTSISCCEYEAVHHHHHLRKKKKENDPKKENEFSFRI
jgi:hypothetical protein